MLYSDLELHTMSTAIQVGMRNPKISPKPFQLIIDSYLENVKFKGQSILDVGPGQWDFLDIAKENGAAKTVGIDFDPAVCKLGDLRGHETIQTDLRSSWPCQPDSFDGIFCRGSINVFWFSTEETIRAFLESLTGSLREGGWIWIAPWNKPPDNQSEKIVSMVRSEIHSWCSRQQIESIIPSDMQKKLMGIGYGIPFVEIWRKL